jgi:hypothetical protein
MRNRRNGQYQLDCHTFAQYQCMKPDDPEVDDEPEEGPPPPDIAG